MNNTEATKHFAHIDAMKAVAIILVVIGHVLAGCKCDAMTGWDDMVVWKWIYSFHMPLFMFVSGLVCFNPEKHYSVAQIGKRVLSYLMPFFVSGILISMARLGEISFDVLWYFRTLAIFVIVLYVGKLLSDLLFARLQGKLASYGRLILVSIIFIACIKMLLKIGGRYDWFDSVFDIHGHLSHLYMFFLAGWLFRNLNLLDKYLRNDYALAISFFLCIASLKYPAYFSHFNLYQYLWILLTLNLSSLPRLCNSLIVKAIGGGYASYIYTAYLLPNQDAGNGRCICAV